MWILWCPDKLKKWSAWMGTWNPFVQMRPIRAQVLPKTGGGVNRVSQLYPKTSTRLVRSRHVEERCWEDSNRLVSNARWLLDVCCGLGLFDRVCGASVVLSAVSTQQEQRATAWAAISTTKFHMMGSRAVESRAA